MSAKSHSERNDRGIFDRLYKQGEDAMNQVLRDLFGRRAVAEGLGKTMTRAAEAKRRVDRNMQFLLSLLNLPSRSDLSKLQTKIEALQGSLTNLNMKIDRIMAAQSEARPKRAKPRRARRKATEHSASQFKAGEEKSS